MDEVRGKEGGVGRRCRTIAATPDNAAVMQAVVRAWPELHALVRQLQADGLFPGLRGLQITLTGDDDWVAGGLASLPSQKAPQRPLRVAQAPLPTHQD